MKKLSTTAAYEIGKLQVHKLTVGLDLGDRSSYYCVLDEAGRMVLEGKVATTPKALQARFAAMPGSRIALETGMHSPWVSRLLSGLGHETIVAHARNVRLIGESRRKDDQLDAQTLAPVGENRSAAVVSGAASQCASAGGSDRDPGTSRPGAGKNGAGQPGRRTGQILRGAVARVQCAQYESRESGGLSRELQTALEPLLAGIEALSDRIREYNERVEKLAQESYPQVGLLKQVKGVGTLIALTFLLTLEDAHRFGKSRDVGCYLGLQPGRRNSGQSEPQMHISKEGDPYLRTLLVQGAQHILGPFGVDCDLRRWGLKLAERGGKNGKKRAIIATARKLAVLLHRLWVSGEAYEPLRNNTQPMPAAA